LDADSECAGGPAEALWCVLITLAFAMIVFLTAWHGPDCRSPQRSISIGSAVLMAGCAQRRALMHWSA
jgi:tetrahydromethanopterin S-methyltransferase subunit E